MYPHTTIYTYPHTTIYVSSYCSMCPHTTIYVSSCYYLRVLMHYCMCPHTTTLRVLILGVIARHKGVALNAFSLQGMYMSSYYYTFVLILLYMCPHTTICVRILLYVCPHTTLSAFSLPGIPYGYTPVLVGREDTLATLEPTIKAFLEATAQVLSLLALLVQKYKY
jgi:hypothetical protein